MPASPQFPHGPVKVVSLRLLLFYVLSASISLKLTFHIVLAILPGETPSSTSWSCYPPMDQGACSSSDQQNVQSPTTGLRQRLASGSASDFDRTLPTFPCETPETWGSPPALVFAYSPVAGHGQTAYSIR